MANPLKSFRPAVLSKPLMAWYKSVLPGLSPTEAQALEAGDVWWEADLFSQAGLGSFYQFRRA